MEYHSFLFKVCDLYKRLYEEFPSPYGVLFILMENSDVVLVGISREKFPSPYGVSFILISLNLKNDWEVDIMSFRLLTELYSFLLKLVKLGGKNGNVCFRLLTELYSFLLDENLCGVPFIRKFPSPYEVIFILTEFYGVNSTIQNQHVSVSLWSIIHSY